MKNVASETVTGGDDAQRNIGDVNGAWWELGPVFSTTHRGARIISLRPGALPGRFTANMLLRALLTAVAWSAGAYLVLPRILTSHVAPFAEEMTRHWWYWVIVIIGIVMLVFFGGAFGLSKRVLQSFGQQSVAMFPVGIAVTFGFFIAGCLHLRHIADYRTDNAEHMKQYELPDSTVLWIFTTAAGVACLFGLVLLPLVLHRTARMQHEIARIRAVGDRYEGKLTQIDFRNGQIDDKSQFTVVVGYETPEGPMQLKAHMATLSTRVPLLNAPVAVFVASGAGPKLGRKRGRGTLIEPDPARRITFDPDSEQYVVRADGGGA